MNPNQPKKFDYKGEKLTILQLSIISPVTQSTIKARINKGWSIEDAVDQAGNKTYPYKGERLTIIQLSNICGLSTVLIKRNIDLGYPVEESMKNNLVEMPVFTCAKVNADHNKAIKRDDKLKQEHQQFARCTARINAK